MMSSHHHPVYEVHSMEVDEVQEDEEEKPFYDVHVCSWNGQHCVEWACRVCQKRGVDTNKVDLHVFHNTNGASLQRLSRRDFCNCVGEQYGAMFWKELRSFTAKHQKQRCANCVKIDEIPELIPWSNNMRFQQTASDLSSRGSSTTRSQQNSPSPRPYQGYSTSYSNPVSPLHYEVHSRYTEDHSPPRSYQGSPSPGYQERVRSPEDYPPSSYLPPTPDSYQSHRHSPQFLYPEHIHRKTQEEQECLAQPRKPLPDLILMEDVDDSPPPPSDIRYYPKHPVDPRRVKSSYPRGSLEHFHSKQPIQVIYTPHQEYSSHPTHASQSAHPDHQHNSAQVYDSHHGSRVIHYAKQPLHRSHLTHPASHTSHPTHKLHYNHPSHHSGRITCSVLQRVKPRTNKQHSSSSVTANGSDDEDDDDEDGRLVIDLDADPAEQVATEAQDPQRQMADEGFFPHLQKIPTKRRRDRGPKSWEFLMRLLSSSETNPSIIKWEDEAETSFRLVQPQEIADMWGNRSNKEKLSYNNFARALRYHYKTGLLYKISERQLVYGCGELALSYYRQLLEANEKTSSISSPR